MNKLFRKGTNFIKRNVLTILDWLNFKKNLKLFQDNELYILISHNGDGGGGAPVVLYEYAKYLVSLNKKVLFLVGRGGELVDNARNNGMHSYRMEWLYKRYLYQLAKKEKKIYICNTIITYRCVNELINNGEVSPIIWWLHEEDKLLKKYISNIPSSLPENVKIACVSEHVKETLQSLRSDIYCEVMFYGCHDLYEEYKYIFESYKKSEKYIISVIGRICTRKNQLQIVEAYLLLPDELKKMIEIHLVSASAEQGYYDKLQKKIYGISNIKIVGPIPREKMYEIYLTSNLIVCCSIDDPLPVVITEAMMFKRKYITSSVTGQVSLIKNKYNGLCYNITDVKELVSLIEFAFYHRNELSLEENARLLFKEYFSMEYLNNKIDFIIQQL